MLLVLGLPRNFSYTAHVNFSEESHTFLVLVLLRSFTLLMLLLMKWFSYTLDASFSEEFLLHS